MANAYLLRQKQHDTEVMEDTREIFEQFAFDVVMIALNRCGVGYTRFKKFTEKWDEVYNQYFSALRYTDVEADVLREHMDEEIRRIIKGRQPFIPFDQRYPKLKKIDYSKSCKSWRK